MGGPLDQTSGQSSPEPKAPPAQDELQAMLKRLDELLAGTMTKRSVQLPEELANVWSTCFAALQGFVQFVASPSREDAVENSAAVAGELRDAVARMQEVRLAGHAASAGEAAGDSAQENIRAICPRCQELYQWAPKYYANTASSMVSERLCDLRRRCESRAQDLRREVALERGRLRQIVDNELEGIFAARTAPEDAGALPAVPKLHLEQGSEERSAPASAGTAAEEDSGKMRLQQPRSTLEMIRQRTSEIRRQRTRRLAGEQFDALRRAKADEVMGFVEERLEEEWENSMGSWLEEAVVPPLLATSESPAGGPPVAKEKAAKDWRTDCALDCFEATPLTPGATPCQTPRTPKATLLQGNCDGSMTTAAKANGTPVATPCRLLDEQKKATPSSVFRIDVMDDVQESYKAAFSGHDVVRDFEQNYEMFNSEPKNLSNLVADDV